MIKRILKVIGGVVGWGEGKIAAQGANTILGGLGGRGLGGQV